MSIIVKKFVSSPFCTPKLTYTSGDTDFTADFTEEWGPEFGEAVQAVGELAVELFRISPDYLSRMELASVDWVKDGRTKYRISAEAILKTRLSYIVGPCTLKTPWLNDEDLAVGELAVELFRISPDYLSRMELASVDWVKDGRTKYRISAEAILKTRLSYIVGPCTLETPWLNDEDLDGIADDAVKRMETLREVCAEYVLGRQRAQMELFDYEDLGIVDVSSHGMLRQAQREGGESKIDKLNHQYLLDNPDIASRILSQKGGE